jgi:hypothetical protein
MMSPVDRAGSRAKEINSTPQAQERPDFLASQLHAAAAALLLKHNTTPGHIQQPPLNLSAIRLITLNNINHAALSWLCALRRYLRWIHTRKMDEMLLSDEFLSSFTFYGKNLDFYHY